MSAYTPRDVRTLGEMFIRAAERHPGKAVRTFSPERSLTFERLARDGHTVAAGLRSLGVRPAAPVAVLVQSPLDFLRVTGGVVLAGAVMVPLAVSAGFNKAFLARMRQVLADSGSRFAVIDDAYADALAEVASDLQVIPLSRVLADQGGAPAQEPFPPPEVGEEDLALIQYTSGSTSAPRGVALTHRNILAGIRVLQRGAGAQDGDVLCHWLPLSHDMGLFSTLGAIAAGLDIGVSAPQDFIKRPEEWLRWFCDLGATMYAGPSSGYRYLLDSIPPEEVPCYDLSAVRVMLNGAEPIDPDLVTGFQRHFAPAGLAPEVMTPCYGLAEATLAVTFAPVGGSAQVDWVDRDLLNNAGEAKPATPGDVTARGVVNCGEPVPEVEVRIVADGLAVAERVVGDIEIRGEPVMRGYHREATATVSADGWCPTGDLGYFAGSALHVTGRRKEMIIFAGRNHYPEDVEARVRPVEGVYQRRAVAVVLPADPGAGRPERIGVLAEVTSALPPYDDRVSDIRAAAAEELGGASVDVVLLGRNGLLRTTSGKFQRLLMRGRLLDGTLARVLTHVAADERVFRAKASTP
ncbi:hypothetical protein GCM10022226_41360 [Sphaerisporangium flaviroseum]|uniref:AMP-dependent synthetase/ligase domain-containing protein n=1 Tax=Sphaerisporangium flaviroseum TaxID=509199 RepID=A0ABP7IEE7_9ACTN